MERNFWPPHSCKNNFTSTRFRALCDNHVVCLEPMHQYGPQQFGGVDGGSHRASRESSTTFDLHGGCLNFTEPLIHSPQGGFPQLGMRSGVGGIFHNSMGMVLFAYSTPLAQYFSIFVAEAMSILHGLRRALAEGYTKIVVQSDCEVVVNLVQTKTI